MLEENDGCEQDELKEKLDLLRVILSSIEGISKSSDWRDDRNRVRVGRLSHTGLLLIELVEAFTSQNGVRDVSNDDTGSGEN